DRLRRSFRRRGLDTPAEPGDALALERRGVETEDALAAHLPGQGRERRPGDLLGRGPRSGGAGVDRVGDLVERTAADRVMGTIQDEQPPGLLELALRPSEPGYERGKRLGVALEQRLDLGPRLLLVDPRRDDAGQE